MKRIELRAPQWLDRGLMTGLPYTLCLSEADYHFILRDIGEPENTWGEWVQGHANATAHHFPETDKHLEASIVCIRNWEGKDPIAVAGLLCHEAVHIFQRFCARIGEDEPSSEFEAYSIQWLTQCLLWEFVRQTEEARLASTCKEQTMKSSKTPPKPDPNKGKAKGKEIAPNPKATGTEAPPFGTQFPGKKKR